MVRSWDPSRTTMLRLRAYREFRKRWRYIVHRVIEALQFLGLTSNINSNDARIFEFLFSSDTTTFVNRFMLWFENVLNEEIFDSRTNLPSWFDKLLSTSYVTGVKSGHSSFTKILSDVRDRVGKAPLNSDELSPQHRERLNIIRERSFVGLKGINDLSSYKLNQLLSDGIVKGDSTDVIAKKIFSELKNVQNFSLKRAKTFARTEIIKTHNIATVRAGEDLAEDLGTTVYYRWIASLDELVRPEHARRHGKIFTINKIMDLIGDINCRCTVTIVVVPFGDPIPDIADKFF